MDPHPVGLAGHSDADVATHAVIDAILGAAGLGDLGESFPDTDPAYSGADSMKLLAAALSKVGARGLRVAQVDLTRESREPSLHASSRPGLGSRRPH